MYFIPAALASFAHARGAPGFGKKRAASFSYSSLGQISWAIAHSWRPKTE
jgi:hypothetical protein